MIYYESEYGVLYKGDCLEIMPSIQKEVGLVLTDPPYGTTACKWDSIIPFEPMWEQLKRIIKPNSAVVMFGSEPFSSALRMSNIKNYKYDWIWDKHIPRGFQVAKYSPMMRHENVMVFSRNGERVNYYPIMEKRDKPVRVRNYSKKNKVSSNDIGKYNDEDKYFVYTHKNPDSMIEGLWEANAGKVHPTQKPVALMEYLIKTYTNEGETVLDFTMGSGSTGVAAINMGRKFIGIEMNEEYCEIAKQRIIEAEKKQEDLFGDI